MGREETSTFKNEKKQLIMRRYGRDWIVEQRTKCLCVFVCVCVCVLLFTRKVEALSVIYVYMICAETDESVVSYVDKDDDDDAGLGPDS